MLSTLLTVLVCLIGYLLGSIPFGLLLTRVAGLGDIRGIGSGNIGATNVLRTGRKGLAAATLLLDALKGAIAVLLVRMLVDDEDIALLAGLAAVLGHLFPVWLNFKGGKGISTTAGVYLALAPAAIGIAVVVFILAVVLTRYVSVGSILGAVALPSAVWFLQPHNLLLGIVTTALGVLAIYKHKANIQRLRAGTESRLKKETK